RPAAAAAAGVRGGRGRLHHPRHLIPLAHPHSKESDGAMTATLLPDVTDATFEETLAAGDLPVLVDFWAPWWGPCTMMEPMLADLAAQWSDRLRVVRVDVDANPVVVRRYGVMSMPTLMVFRDGEPVLRLVGARGRNQLMAELDEVL